MQLQPQQQLEQSLEQNNTISYSRLVDELQKEEEQQKNQNQFKSQTNSQKQQKQKETSIVNVSDEKEYYLYCVDGPEIKINYSDKQHSKPRPNDTPIHRTLNNPNEKVEAKPISKSEHCKKNNNNKLIHNGNLNPIIENDSENKKSDEEVNSQQFVVDSKVYKAYQIGNFDQASNYKTVIFGKQNGQDIKVQSNRRIIRANNSVYIQQIQQSILLPSNEPEIAEKISQEKEQGGAKSSRIALEEDKRILSSLTTASKLVPKAIQQKNEEENASKDPYLHMINRLSRLQSEVNLLKEKKMSKASKSVNPHLKSSKSHSKIIQPAPIIMNNEKQSTNMKIFSFQFKKTESIQNKQSDFNNYSDDSLIKLANQPVWKQLIDSIKINARVQNCIKKLTQILNINQNFQILNKEALIVALGDNQMLNISYSQKVYIGEYIKMSGVFIKQGFGLEIDPCNSIYRGSFSNGLRDGHGKFIALGKYKHQGQWKKGIMEGKGILYQDIGSIYIGNFVSGKKEGLGSQRIYNGDKYEGQFKNDSYHGKGFYTWKNGSHYKGDFVNNKMHGIGILKSSNGDVFQGNFINGLKDTQRTSHNRNSNLSQKAFMKQSPRRSTSRKMQIKRQRQSPKKYTIYLKN